MTNKIKSALLGILCASTAGAAMPPEAYAMAAAPPAAVGLSPPVETVHYFRRYYRPYYRPYVHRRAYYPSYGYYRRPVSYRPRPVYYARPVYYYSRPVYYGYPAYYGGGYGYGYNPGGAMFAGAALGLMGAGIAAASRPHWGGGWGHRHWGW
jgi:hypothetical protein